PGPCRASRWSSFPHRLFHNAVEALETRQRCGRAAPALVTATGRPLSVSETRHVWVVLRWSRSRHRARNVTTNPRAPAATATLQVPATEPARLPLRVRRGT